MDKETFFFTLFAMFYLSQPSNRYHLFVIISRMYYYSMKLIDRYNAIVYPDFFYSSDDDTLNEENDKSSQDDNNGTNDGKDKKKEEMKYEDKYLAEIRNMDKEYIFDQSEEQLKHTKYNDFLREITDAYTSRMKEITNELANNEAKLKQLEDNDYCICEEEDTDNYGQMTKEEIIVTFTNANYKLNSELYDIKKYNETDEGREESVKKATERTDQFMIDQRLEKLKYCFVMEHTPLGNVLMAYDKERDTFKYYSDNTIPYRYLEVVGRKFVKQFHCRPIFVDMEDELKLAEAQLEREKAEKEEREVKRKKLNEDKINNPNLPTTEQKKNVFAKFKTYNKEAGSGRVNTSAPPKNSIPSKPLTETMQNEKVLLKTKANRYTYEGKMVNFSFIKKIDRKVVDKKLSMTFADFKKMQLMKSK